MEQHTPKQPGQQVKALMEAKGWSQEDLANVLGRPRPFVNRLINGRVKVTPRTANQLAAAFEGMTAYDWMHMQVVYDLWEWGHRKETRDGE